MARIDLEYDGKPFTIDDDLTYGVYVERVGNFSWRVEVRPGLLTNPVLSFTTPTPTHAELTRRTLLALIDEATG